MTHIINQNPTWIQSKNCEHYYLETPDGNTHEYTGTDAYWDTLSLLWDINDLEGYYSVQSYWSTPGCFTETPEGHTCPLKNTERPTP
jgi:hypothetical protein